MHSFVPGLKLGILPALEVPVVDAAVDAAVECQAFATFLPYRVDWGFEPRDLEEAGLKRLRNLV